MQRTLAAAGLAQGQKGTQIFRRPRSFDPVLFDPVLFDPSPSEPSYATMALRKWGANVIAFIRSLRSFLSFKGMRPGRVWV